MIKFGYVTDQHSTGRTPSTRTDVFPLTNEEKIREFHNKCHEAGVDFFLYGGDWGDSPYLSQRFVGRLAELYEEGHRGKDSYGVFGNHDMNGWNPNTLQDTSLGLHMRFNKSFTLLESTPIIRTYHGQKIALSGVSSYANLDRDTEERPRANDYIVKWNSEIPLIHVVHGYLSPKPILDDILHTTIDEMRTTDARLTLTGHEHTGFAPTMLGLDKFGKEKWACNPGAMSRIFASHVEMNRMPQYLICTIDDNNEVTIEPVQFECAKIGSEVMDRKLLDEKKQREIILEQTRGTMKEVLDKIDIKNVSLDTIMKRFEEEIEPAIFKEATRRIRQYD